MLDDAVTLRADRRPGVRAPAQVVRTHQEELLRAAYLLTGNAAHAARLAEESVHAMLRPLVGAQEEREWRSELLTALADHYLSESPLAAGSTPLVSVPVVERPRFSVDDERTRLWAALERCERLQRLVLVLRDFDQLDEEQVSTLLHRPPAELRRWLNTTRERLCDAVGARRDQTARALLLALSLGAPRLDLWAELAEPARRIAEQERRRRRLVIGGVGATLAIALLTAIVWLTSGWLDDEGDGEAQAASTTATLPPLVTPTPRPAATPTAPAITRPEASVPDIQLVSYSHWNATEDRQSGGTIFYDPASGPLQSVEDFSDYSARFTVLHAAVEISPDGTRLLAIRGSADNTTADAQQQRELACTDATTGELLWERPVLGLRHDPVLLNDRVIGLHFGMTVDEMPRLVAYDMADGRELGSWPVDATSVGIEQWFSANLWHIYSSPDLTRLSLVIEQPGQTGTRARRAVLTYALPEMTLVDSIWTEYPLDPASGTASFNFWGARPTPDGAALYTVQLNEPAGGVRFLDLASAEVSSVELPFPTWQEGNISTTHVVPSHDGRWLYIVTPSGEVAVVDLLERRLARVFQLDSGDYTFSAGERPGWFWDSDAGFFSPDGRTLYLLDHRLGSQITPDSLTVVWVVDVAEWRVHARWETRGAVSAASLSADGGRIYLTSVRASETAPDSGDVSYQLYELDTATGQTHRFDEELPALQGNSGAGTLSLQQLYRQRHGFTPSSAGVTPQDVTEFATLPRVELDVSEPFPAAGEQVRFTVRFVHPASGAPVSDATGDVRYSSAAGVTLTLSNPGVADVIAFPSQTSASTFEAVLPLEALGVWQVTANVSYPDGTRWSQTRPGLIEVLPSFTASDGKRYQLRLSTEPAQPVVEALTALRLTLVEVERGARLPEGVELASALPERIDIIFMRENGSPKAGRVELTGHGLYEGETTFYFAGRWRAALSLGLSIDGSSPLRVNAGTFQVVANGP